jgi:hypothetical protein
VKITLNDTIPVARRPQVEALVKTFVRSPEIAWLPSRFPHLVMFLDPGSDDWSVPEKSSIFESPRAGMRSTAAMTAMLEDHIKACLAKPLTGA